MSAPTSEGTALSLPGKELAAALRAQTAERAAGLSAAGTPPKLVVVVATEDGSSLAYVRSIAKAAEKAGIACEIADLGGDASAARIRDTLTALSDDGAVHGIILQTPLPAGVALREVSSAIDPAKDIDGSNPAGLGRLAAGLPGFAPATAEAVMAILDQYEVPLAGRHAVVVGRSIVVGIPVTHLLLSRHATVTVCHSRTPDLAAHTRQADVLVVAAGRPGLIGEDHVASGTVVVDVGTNPTEDGRLVGDVDFERVRQSAGAVTPVPGGVGPVTTAVLLRNTVDAADATRVS